MNNATEKVHSIVKKTIADKSLVADGDFVLVALSGGADSVCLLGVLCRLKEQLNISVAAAHLNHMIRGEEAERDMEYAKKLCSGLGITLHTKSVNVPELAAKQGISEELAGRNARYDFFKELSAEFGYNKIATAHNRNDRAETVLMRIMRGTGIDGLCGIKYKREDGVIRPVLDVERADIEAYCAENGLEYCVDSTNLSNDYTRNKIRNELIPFIEQGFNPGITDTLCALADNSLEDAEFINGYAKRLYKRINSPMPKRYPNLVDIETLKAVDDSICTRLIRIALRDKMGDAYNPGRTHIDLIKNLLDKETGACAELPDGLKAYVKYGWLELTTEADKQTDDYCYEIEITDKLKAEDDGISFKITEENFKPGKNQMVLNYDLLEDKKLFLRNRRMGDRMVFFADGRTRKIKDYFIDKKIPRSERAGIPLLCTEDEVVAIIGDRVSEAYKPNKDTKKGLVITYESKNENR